MKKSFLFGSNYSDTQYKLSCCVKDCKLMENFLTKIGYKNNSYYDEKALNWDILKNKLETFINSLKSGDKAFIFYSGHGTWLKDDNGDEFDGQDECIFVNNNIFIRDDVLTEMLQKIPEKVEVICMFDCCHSGTILDLTYSLKNLKLEKENNKKFKASIALISGCIDSDVSLEDGSGGYLSQCFMSAWVIKNSKIDKSRPLLDFYLKITTLLSVMSVNRQLAQLSVTDPSVLKMFI